jgi:hypothetical protein
LQAPATQLLAVMPQLVHAAPPVPHADEVVGVVHVDPEQQPVEHVDELHPLQTPPAHVPAPQFEHTPPPDPQVPAVLPGWQALPKQHPVAHELALQMHVPPEQTWPDEQAAPPPQVHVPVPEQPSAWAPQLTHAEPLVPQEEDDVVVMHVGPAQQPVGHDAGSQTHAPPEHI